MKTSLSSSSTTITNLISNNNINQTKYLTLQVIKSILNRSDNLTKTNSIRSSERFNLTIKTQCNSKSKLKKNQFELVNLKKQKG